MKQNSEKRWYDKNPDLKAFLEKLKYSNKSIQDIVLNDIKNLIMNFDSKLVDTHVMEFPLTEKRRWYDKDPYSWLAINALKYADEIILKDVINLKNKL
jgi:hypothetical protein